MAPQPRFVTSRLTSPAAHVKSLRLVVPFKYGLPYSEELYTQTNDVDEFLHRLGRRIGALRQGGFIDLPRAATFFLNKFRTGKLGRWTLDDLELRNDLYRDPLFSFYPELLATSSSLDGSLAGTKPPTTLDLAEKHHMSLLLPPEKTSHPDIKFNPANPPWAPPISEDEEEVRLAKLAPPIQVPTDLKAKVHEAVRRYFWSKKERDEAISETQKKKLISDARKRKSQQIGENRRLERLYAAGIRPRALPRGDYGVSVALTIHKFLTSSSPFFLISRSTSGGSADTGWPRQDYAAVIVVRKSMMYFLPARETAVHAPLGDPPNVFLAHTQAERRRSQEKRVLGHERSLKRERVVRLPGRHEINLGDMRNKKSRATHADRHGVVL